ncbi:CAP domain-containing protein [Cytobacillus massiliigabonensis]|uniref:CAP domain-containing protein n=1 Tax=Cytobacillus massiliigabonensis TaxID=1871011 RepID=UPI001F1A13F8|nr:CAP domain-containing protein [Cytobacillus massiliigabonensis]
MNRNNDILSSRKEYIIIIIINDRKEEILLRNLVRILVLISGLLAVVFLFNTNISPKEEILVNEEEQHPKVDQTLDEVIAQQDSSNLEIPQESLINVLGKSSKELIRILGEPERKDPTFYGYDWWIYKMDLHTYVQVGVEKEKVVTIYATGSDVQIPPFKIGQSISDIYHLTTIEANIGLDYGDSSYMFELSEDDMNTRPLIKLGNAFLQLYIDKFTGTLSSIRMLNAKTLIEQRPYEMVYRGELLEVNPPVNVIEEKVEKGNERQIFDITNMIRERHDLEPLEWDEETAEVAFAHSKDMFETNDFSHTSKKYGELSDRLDAANIFYQTAGENIAANYLDAPAVAEGWLNSKGHRESLLNEKFTHLGVGVYKKHYTQNFIEKWSE